MKNNFSKIKIKTFVISTLCYLKKLVSAFIQNAQIKYNTLTPISRINDLLPSISEFTSFTMRSDEIITNFIYQQWPE